MHAIGANLERINKRIASAAERCGRTPDAVQLVAVSKTLPPATVHAAVQAGITLFGENYIQEAREKFNALAAQPVTWHFIGHLQSNKAKYAVRMFDLIHSVDSIKLAGELNKQAQKINKRQAVLIQVNISGETTKSGTTAQNALALARHIIDLEHLSLKGLMTMPPFFNQPEKARPYFKSLHKLAEELNPVLPADAQLTELSMGMTGDFETAVEEGATLVRIGTALFGERD